MKCTVCSHPQCPDIDLALLSGGHTLKSLHQQYGPSKSSLFRHRKHLVIKLVQSREDLESSRQQVSLLKLNAFLEHVQRHVEAAAAAGDIDRVFKGSHIGSRIIHQINQMDVPLELDTVYRLISAPGFVSQDSLLPSGPEIITDLHQALFDKAFFPCPDLPPEIVAVADDEDENDHDVLNATPATDDDYDDDADKAEAPDPSFLFPDHCPLETETQQAQFEALRLLQHHFPDLDLTAAAVALAEKDPKNQRDTSAKLPRQTDPHSKNIYENQQHDCHEKNYSKHLNVGWESDAPFLAVAATPLPPDSFETQNSKLETDKDAPLPPDSLETQNSEPETAFPEKESAFCPLPSANCLYDETAARADDLFLMTHGYPRDNPPKHIPNRRREEDFRSSSIFGDPKKIFG